MSSQETIHSLRRKIRKICGERFSEGNRVTLLWKDSELFRGIFDSVRSAEKFICLEFYIFRNDDTGTELAEILSQKAAEGIKVYLLYDHFGSIGTPVKFWKNLRAAGVQIRASHPFKWTAPLHYVHRDHRKLIIIDGIRAFTGGLNIANEYTGYHLRRKKKGWRDTGLIVEGPVVNMLLNTFRERWHVWKGGLIPFQVDVGPMKDDGLPAIPIFASSARGRRKMRRLIYESINMARESIYLTTAYFTPSRRFIQILENAVKRGASVKLLLPGKTDIEATRYTGRAFYTRLLKAGIEIYNYSGQILHAKTAVFDGIWSIIGSANLDFQSLRRNDEGNVGIIDAGFGRRMTEIFFEDLKHSDQIKLPDWRKRRFCEKMKEHFYVLFRRRL